METEGGANATINDAATPNITRARLIQSLRDRSTDVRRVLTLGSNPTNVTPPPPGVTPSPRVNTPNDGTQQRHPYDQPDVNTQEMPKQPDGSPGNGPRDEDIKERAEEVVDDCQEFLETFQHAPITQKILDRIEKEAELLAERLKQSRKELERTPTLHGMLDVVNRWRAIVRNFMVASLAKFPAQNPAPAPTAERARSPPRRATRDKSPETMGRLEQDITFFLNEIKELEDIGPGAHVPNDTLRDLHDVVLPQTQRNIDELRRILKEYTFCGNYDRHLARAATEECQEATKWIYNLRTRHRQQKLHLDHNLKHKEVNFKPFKPNDEVSVYEFFSRFEEWADGYLSEDAKANQLFHRYLDHSVTDSYAEIVRVRDNYGQMKDWLMKKFGSVVPMAHGYIRAISRLKVPGESDLAENVRHLRAIHKLLSSLSELEISKGVPVPKLQDYLGSNAFLSALVQAIPSKVRWEFTKVLVKEGIDDFESLEGSRHLVSILYQIKVKYRELEMEIAATANISPSIAKPAAAPGKKAPQAASSHVSANSHPQSGQGAARSPTLTGGNAVPVNNSRAQTSTGVNTTPKPVLSRWTCPIRGHTDHQINQCVEFFNLDPGERRQRCRFGGCFSCLSKTDCKTGCVHFEDIPAELICTDCANTMTKYAPPCVLFCGRPQHKKPTVQDLTRSLEAWIPNLNIQSLGASLRVNLTWLGVHSAIRPPPDVSTLLKTGPPTAVPSNVVFDTATGEKREIKDSDKVVKASQEVAFYAMQTIRIKDKDVLLFFDSGSNGHLIEGSLAEKLELDVVTDDIVPIGALGGKTIWSDYGTYMLTIGPDVNGECHELESQGIETITTVLPEVNLQSLWEETDTFLKGKKRMPIKVGGQRVGLLVGIKSTKISPKLLHTLPNGLGIFESVIYDRYQSNICFGGPHSVFTDAYRSAGRLANCVETLFTEMARAYMDLPRSFIAADVDEHGPPRFLARELNLLESFKETFPYDSKDKDCLGCGSPELSDDIFSSEFPENGRDDLKKVEEKIMDYYQDEDDPIFATTSCKGFIPLNKLKGLQDEIDIPEVVDFRCDSCSNCPNCKLSARAKTKSLQEEFEQEVIKKSVYVDLAAAKVLVDLPFIKDPVEFLSKKHGGNNNFAQAEKMYVSQCKKPEDIKTQIRKAQSELAEKLYMVPLKKLPTETQNFINNAPFKHVYPWKAVYKVGSATTPVRLVVDPTMTGLNEILAKGSNMLSKIPELLVNFRSHKFSWNTDISKLYNQLHLNNASLPYSLFLYHESLDPATPPEVWVMSRAWYGVVSTGNQAGVAMEFLANTFKEEFPAAYDPLMRWRYVDDILSGAGTKEERESQILETQECLKTGGFTMKYIAKSGEKPPEKASTDHILVGCLGLAWDTEKDTLRLGFDEDFFLKRVRGQKPVANKNLKDPEVLKEVLAEDLMTRAGILSRVAELYDPCGWWENVKIQMKFALQGLNGLDWKSPVPADQRKEWVLLFQLMQTIKEVQIPRSVIPENTPSDTPIRLLVVADAAARACGCTIYAGVRRPDGHYTCDLLLAKSKMVHSTIPRNELEAVVLAAESSLVVQRALSGRMENVVFFTDSRIVICWVVNKSKRLRMWAYNRVQAVVNMISHQTDGEECIPLYHISGQENPADILTKVRFLKTCDMQTKSVWYTGLEWMTKSNDCLPKDQFDTLPVESLEPYNKEIFQEVECHQLAESIDQRVMLTAMNKSGKQAGRGVKRTPHKQTHSWLFSTFKFLEVGWVRAWNRLTLVVKACAIFKHGLHRKEKYESAHCPICTGDPLVLYKIVSNCIYVAASDQTEKALSTKKMNETYHKKDGVWLASSRLEKEGAVEVTDLDCTPFFDSMHIQKLLPVMLVASETFHAYLIFIHFVEFQHMGVENTLRRIMQRFYPVGNARSAIAKLKKACPKCRMLLKKTVAIELGKFPEARTVVAPPFYTVQMDIVMAFKARAHQRSTSTFACNALVIVCLLTCATSIMVMDGLSTQTVIQAIERHAARYGMPAQIIVDAGTQLRKLEDTNFRLRDLSSSISGERQFKVTVATPKAHHQQGRVESKVKNMMKMLNAWSKTHAEDCNTLIGWETVFARIASALDDVPIARGSASAASDLGWEIITPNRLKLGRNNFRGLEGPVKLDNAPQSHLERNRMLTATWYEMFIERIHLLIPPPAKENDRQPELGDVVLFVHQDPNVKKLWTWKLGVIEEKISRSSYRIHYITTETGEPRHVVRAVAQISIIVPVDELPPSHPDFLKQ